MGNALANQKADEHQLDEAAVKERELIEASLRKHGSFPYKKFYFKASPREKFKHFEPANRKESYSQSLETFVDDLLKSDEISGVRFDLERSRLQLSDLENILRLIKLSPSKLKVLSFNFESTYLNEEAQQRISDIFWLVSERYPDLVELRVAIGFNTISETIFADMLKSVFKLKNLNEFYFSTLNSRLSPKTITDSITQILCFENLFSLTIDLKDLIFSKEHIKLCLESVSKLPLLYILSIDAAGLFLKNDGLLCICEPLANCKFLANFSLGISNAGLTDITPLIDLVNKTYYLSFLQLDMNVNNIPGENLNKLEEVLMTKPFLVGMTVTKLRPAALQKKMAKKKLGIIGLMKLEEKAAKFFRKEIIYDVARKLYEAQINN